jgi:hypothetical protein
VIQFMFDYMKGGEMGGACGTYGVEAKGIRDFGG